MGTAKIPMLNSLFSGNTVIQALFTILERLPRLFVLYEVPIKLKHNRELKKWKANGCPLPPPHLFKQKVLINYAEKYGLKVFIETGTYQGDMIRAMLRHFEQLFSIELSPRLYRVARARFRRAYKVKLVQGDSARELAPIITQLRLPALYWLDGHFSAGVTEKGDTETPIRAELSQILSRQELPPYVIIIDDARCFGTVADYPTIDEITQLVRMKRCDLNVCVLDDMIRITPQ